MDVDNFHDQLGQAEVFQSLLKKLKEDNTNLQIKGLAGSSAAVIAAELHCHNKGSHLFILNDNTEAIYFENDLQSLLDKKEVLFLPDSFKRLGYFDVGNSSNIQLRAETLNHLVHPREKSILMVSHPEALIEKVIGRKKLKENTIQLKVGEK